MNPLIGFLEPNSIVVLGASKKKGSLSALTVRNLLKFGYEGELYLVNPRGGELEGMKVYSDLLEIEAPVDLAIVYLPPMIVVDGIEACIRKGIRSAKRCKWRKLVVRWVCIPTEETLCVPISSISTRKAGKNSAA